MSPEKEKILFDKYPKLYRGRYESIQMNLMSFGFECGDGWFDLLNQLSESIEKRAYESGLTDDQWPIAEQVKEKFGGLRYYYSSQIEIDDLVNAAEQKSETTCEKCGSEGQNELTHGWLSVRCEKCRGTNAQ